MVKRQILDGKGAPFSSGKSHKKPKYFMFAVTWLYGKYFRTSIKFKGYTN